MLFFKALLNYRHNGFRHTVKAQIVGVTHIHSAKVAVLIHEEVVAVDVAYCVVALGNCRLIGFVYNFLTLACVLVVITVRLGYEYYVCRLTY